jgi:hypothetical protein
MFSLPFTSDQFFGVFAEYNHNFGLVAVALWIVTLVMLVAAWRNPRGWSRALTALLAVSWLWNAGAYHALLFTRINPAAWLFAALFAVQAGLFVVAATRRELEYFQAAGVRGMAGLLLTIYALAYPALTIASGHVYPAVPTFGVPCPTAILTIGLLVTVRGGPPLTLSIVPIVWAFIGGSAALLLGVVTDYVLLVAGVMLAPLVVWRRSRGAATRRR